MPIAKLATCIIAKITTSLTGCGLGCQYGVERCGHAVWERRPRTRPRPFLPLGETARDASGTRPGPVRFFKFYLVGRIRDASAAVSP
eukprot:gene22892-biopygen20782